MSPQKAMVIAALGVLSCGAPARADGPFQRAFLSGQTPGEPGTGKRVTAYSLYGLSALSVGGGVYFLYDGLRARRESDDFNRAQPNACADLASESCGRASAMDEDGNRSLNLALAGFAVGATLTLSGMLVAEYWPNLAFEPQLAVSPTLAEARATLRF